MTTWTKPFPPDDLWLVSLSKNVRLTEDGRLRITEDEAHFRVIEFTRATWTTPFPPPNPWH